MDGMADDLDATVAAARRALGRAESGVAVPANVDDVMVLLSFRVPRSVRAEVRSTAAANGVSAQAWLRRVLDDALQGERSPQGRLTADLARNLRTRLLAAIDAGEYREVVESMSDPDVA